MAQRLNDVELAEKLKTFAFSDGVAGAGAAKLAEKLRGMGFVASVDRIRKWLARQETTGPAQGADRVEATRARKFDVEIPNALQQADTLYLPMDKDGSKYVLEIWDAASRFRAAVPMKDRESKTVAKAFQSLYDSDSPLTWPKVLSVDAGSEFGANVKALMAAHGVVMRVGATGDHRHVGGAESTGRSIAKRLFGAQSVSEAQTGKIAKDWVHALPDIMRELNSEMNHDIHQRPDVAVHMRLVIQPGQPVRKLSSQTLLEVGTKVRVLLPQPSEGGTRFRATDMQWSRTVYTITKMQIAHDTSAAYLTTWNNDRWFVRAGLLPVYGDVEPVPGKQQDFPEGKIRAEPEPAPAAAAPLPAGTDVVERIVRPETRRKTPGYEVKWKDYARSQNTWEARARLLEDVRPLVVAFETKHSVVWTQRDGKWSYTWQKTPKKKK